MKQLKNQSLKVRIAIKDGQKKIPLKKKKIARLAEQILKIKGLKQAELSILFAGKKRIRRLNRKFRKIDRPTDVLAFSMRQGKKTCLFSDVLGDVVICPEIAQKSARIHKTTTKQEIYLCLTHGILHLLGHDDSNDKSRALMRKEEKKILKQLKIFR